MQEITIGEAIKKIVDREDLTREEANSVMHEIMSGQTSAVQNAALLAALSTKSSTMETADEIAGCAEAMRSHAVKVDTPYETLEIVGTGGDHAGSFNISTTAAIVAAAGGVKVSKHGNRAASSQCGTADALEALGINIRQEPERAALMIEKGNMAFLFAQLYHPSMKYVGPIRKELGIRTVFNILGPLTNPASPSMQLLGVYDEALVEPLAKVLMNLGVKDGMVVYGEDRLDEISLSSETLVCEFHDGQSQTYTIKPEQFGLIRCAKDDLKGGDPNENAAIIRSILSGEISPKRDAVLLNAGAALYLAHKAESMQEGIELAASLIDNGSALAKLEELRMLSNLDLDALQAYGEKA